MNGFAGTMTIEPAASCDVSQSLNSQWRNADHWHTVWPEGDHWCYPTPEAAAARAIEVTAIRAVAAAEQRITEAVESLCNDATTSANEFGSRTFVLDVDEFRATMSTPGPSAAERVAVICDQVEANPVGWGGALAVSLARTIRAAATTQETPDECDLTEAERGPGYCPTCRVTDPTDECASRRAWGTAWRAGAATVRASSDVRVAAARAEAWAEGYRAAYSDRADDEGVPS